MFRVHARLLPAILLVFACTALSAPAQAAKPAPLAAAVPEAVVAETVPYRLGSGDKVRLTVYNEETLSGEYEVDGSGNLSIQLIGTISAVGKTLPEVKGLIETKLKDGQYMLNPSIALEVLNYRPFYVLGEVKTPGKYPFVSGMTVLNAIALAGGYTYRGKKAVAYVIRATDPNKKEAIVTPNEVVMPGDIIRVPERVF